MSKLPTDVSASDASVDNAETDSGSGADAKNVADNSPTTGNGTGRKRMRRSREWIWLPLTLVAIAVFLIYTLPAYLGLDPEQSRVPILENYSLHYPLLVGHIFLGTVALVTGALQMSKRLRTQRPQVHRWLGQIYFFGGVFPAGVLVLGVAPVTSNGFGGSVGNSLLAIMWWISSIAAYRAARQRRYHTQHRAWAIRSFALTASIVANRISILVLYYALLPLTGPLFDGDPNQAAEAAAESSIWLEWVVYLLVVEWWLLRYRAHPVSRSGARTAPAA